MISRMWHSNNNHHHQQQQRWPNSVISAQNQQQVTVGEDGQVSGYYGDASQQRQYHQADAQQQYQMQNQMMMSQHQGVQQQYQMPNMMQQHPPPQLMPPPPPPQHQIQQQNAQAAHYYQDNGAQHGQMMYGHDAAVHQGQMYNGGQVNYAPPPPVGPPPPPPPPGHIAPSNNMMFAPPQMHLHNMPPPPPPHPPPPRQQFYCELCKIECPNEFSLHQHINGERHKRQEALFNNNRQGAVSEQGQQPFYCTLCRVSCRNELSYQQHMNGEKHRRQVAATNPAAQLSFNCDLCGVSCRTEKQYQQHINGERHRKKAATAAAGGPQTFFCDVCKVSCPNQLSYDQHLNGEKHRRQVESANERNENVETVFHCKICNVSCPNDYSFAQHMNGEKHKKQVAAAAEMNVAGHQRQTFPCEPCKVSCPNEFSYQQHVNSERHKKQMAKMSNSETKQTGGEFHCDICNVKCSNEHSFQQHMNGKKHKKKEAAFRSANGQPNLGASERAQSLSSSETNNGLAQSDLSSQQPPVPSEEESEAKEVRHLNNDKPDDEYNSEEEGEIDEEKEDIDKLYDEFAASDMSSSSTVAQKEVTQGADSDADEMFGDESEEPEPASSVKTQDDSLPSPGLKEESEKVVDDAEANSITASEPDHDIHQQQGHDNTEEPSDQKVTIAEEETGRDDSDLDDMFGDENAEASPVKEASPKPKRSRWAKVAVDSLGKDHIQQETSSNNSDLDDDEQQDDEMFEAEVECSQRWKQVEVDRSSNRSVAPKQSEVTSDKLEENAGNVSQQEAPTILDSGLGFVLDYSPDISIDRKDSPAESKVEASHPQPEPILPDETHEELNQDDEQDMFGSSEDEGENVNEQPSPARPQHEEREDQVESKATMTAADALAAARSRAKDSAEAQQLPAKRSKITSQKHKPVPEKFPAIAPRETLKRTYYPPVHPDKYWSELRHWDFVRELDSAMKKNSSAPKVKEQGTKRPFETEGGNNEEAGKKRKEDALSDTFDSAAQYKALWAPLLIKEAKAQLLSEVVASQSSPSAAWVHRAGGMARGVLAKVELSRTARDLSSSGGSTSSALSDPTVALHIRAATNGEGTGSPVNTNDLLLFVHNCSAIEQAIRGKAFETMDDEPETMHGLQGGRLGFVGHALNHRKSSIDGLLVRVSQKYWNQFSSLNEMFVIRIGANVTALREFNALLRVDKIPLTQYLLDGKKYVCDKQDESNKAQKTEQSKEKSSEIISSLPVGFRIFVKSKMNTSQLQAITAAASEYGEGGFTLIKGPPGTGKSTTLVSVLNAIHLRQYTEYYHAIEKIITGSEASSYYEELAALNKAAEVKPRILVCAPSNAGIDNVVAKIMSDKFVDGNGGKYSPSICRVGAGITNPKVEGVSLKRAVDTIIGEGSRGTAKIEQIVAAGRQNLKRYQKEIQKLRARIQAMIECCPYPISNHWEIRLDEASFDETGRVVFVNHSTKTTTFDIPQPIKPNQTPANIQQMPHYVSLLKGLTKYVERHNNESANLEKYILLQNEVAGRIERRAGSGGGESIQSQLETHVLNTSHIILTTLGSAGSRVVESANRFKVVVIDEAAQSAEPSTLVALQLGSSHAVLVGDPQQLPATIFSVSGRSTKYDRSLFQRLEEAGHDVHLLNTQYRMNPTISEFPRHIFYGGMLLDGSNVLQSDFGGLLKTVIRVKFPHVQPFNIFDLDSKEERDGTSLYNKSEAQLVLQLYRTLDRETGGLVAKSRIAVITPYSQQVALLRRLFQDEFGDSYKSRVEISTVDGFQGREAGIVIYSCVRAGGKGSGIGFLSDVQRMNVALTRAKHFLFVIARRRSIMVNPYWRKLVGYARSKSAIIPVPMIVHNQEEKPKPLKSSLIKSALNKKVSFGTVDKRLYEVNSKANQNQVKVDLFPDLAKLVPMHQATSSQQPDPMSDSYCSA